MQYFIFILALFTSSAAFAQTKDTCITPEEIKLYDLIMAYRADNNLPKIPMSRSLYYVAHQHAWDLQVNSPATGKCNMHSWSKKGPWSPCCYTADHKEAKCMWNKPKELTSYQGFGFEISSYSSDPLTAKDALEIWQASVHHDNVILNKDIWASSTWNAIGIAINGNYAVVWFGKETDAAGEPAVCK
jgi:hypothetical protein